ncbi:MAG: proline dehydrogenase family protein [Chitinophagales bacterium]|nr:proline dehydrogenase family protein [Chitinophagales bacterium]
MPPTTALSFENTEIAFSYKSDKELKKSYWLFSLMNQNWLVKIGTRATPLAFKMHLPIHGLVKSTIFEHFCGGETLSECSAVTGKLSAFHVETILDYGVESKETDEEFDIAVGEFLKAIAYARENSHIPFISIKITGIAAFGLLEKLHAGAGLSDAETLAWNRVKGRIHKICKAAHDAGIGVMMDAEETWIQQPVDDLAMEMMSFYNKEKAIVYNTLQMYRVDRLQFLRDSLEKAKAGNFVYALKLVRGAYMGRERRRAAEMNYLSPIQPDKAASDRDFDAAVRYCLDHVDFVSCCVASHNENSALQAAVYASEKGITPSHPHLHFSQLYGMSDNITFNLAHAGYNVTKYVPYGPVKDVVPYLMRRAQENTSVAGATSRELLLLRKEMKRRKI